MKRILIVVLIIVGSLVVASAQAAITWQGEFDQFRYDVSKNGGDFYYLPGLYFTSNESTSLYYYAPLSGHTDPYDSIASGSLTEFVDQPGEISMDAMALATGTLTSPVNGLMVQAFAEIIPTELNQGQGVDIDQKVQSWVTRLFTVDTVAQHSLKLTLEGAINYNAFNVSSMYKAVYSVIAEVNLEEAVDDGSGTLNFQSVSGFPILMDLADPNQTLTVSLFPADDQQRTITYRLKVNLTLTSEIVNVNFQTFQATGDLVGNYSLGSATEPITLTASFPTGPSGPDELVVDFGSLGLYHYDGSNLKRIHSRNPNGLAANANSLVANFPGSGLYEYDGMTWGRLSANAVQEGMTVAGGALYVDFGSGVGLYRYDGSWARINANSPEQMLGVGDTLYVDFGFGIGLYKYDGKWARLINRDSARLCAVGSTLYVDFGEGVGLYRYDGVWARINKNSVQAMCAVGTDLYIDFGPGIGLYRYNGSWGRINKNDPEDMVCVGATLYVDFGTLGLYKYEGGVMSRIHKANVQGMGSYGNKLVVNFPSVGLYEYNGTTWKRINRNTAENMIAVDLQE